MHSRRRIAWMFLGISLISFAIGYYLYDSYIEFLAIFDYYGIPEATYSQNANTADVLFNFRFGILSFVLGGFVSLVCFFAFFVKSFGINEQKDN